MQIFYNDNVFDAKPSRDGDTNESQKNSNTNEPSFVCMCVKAMKPKEPPDHPYVNGGLGKLHIIDGEMKRQALVVWPERPPRKKKQ